MSAWARSLRPASHTARACVRRSKGRKGKVQTFLQSWLWAESAVKVWCIEIIALVLILSLWRRSMTFSLYFRNQACESFKLGTHNHLTDNRGGRAHSLAPKYILWINSLCCLSAESRTWLGVGLSRSLKQVSESTRHAMGTLITAGFFLKTTNGIVCCIYFLEVQWKSISLADFLYDHFSVNWMVQTSFCPCAWEYVLEFHCTKNYLKLSMHDLRLRKHCNK